MPLSVLIRQVPEKDRDLEATCSVTEAFSLFFFWCSFLRLKNIYYRHVEYDLTDLKSLTEQLALFAVYKNCGGKIN